MTVGWIGDGTGFALYSEDKILAQAELHCYRGVWTLRKCWVRKGYRGNGFQRKLIQMRVNSAKDRKARRVTAWVDPRNSYSLNNLVAEGFKFMHRRMREFDSVNHIGLECHL